MRTIRDYHVALRKVHSMLEDVDSLIAGEKTLTEMLGEDFSPFSFHYLRKFLGLSKTHLANILTMLEETIDHRKEEA